MKTIKLAIALTLSLLCTAVLAHEKLAPIQPGVPGKNRGDIIAPLLDEQIAAWCDFNKQIIVTRTNILCVYIGKVTEKKLPPAKPKKLTQAERTPKDLNPNTFEMTEFGDA